MPKLTIITATYNRSEYLSECWKSLRNQTCKDFQWLIVDDGSTDNTDLVVAGFQNDEPDMCIDYVYKVNGGKHTALNKSHDYIKGQYVVILDSDDRFTSDAVEQILREWEKYHNCTEVGQIIFLKGYSETNPICYVEHENMPLNTLKEPRIGKNGRDCCDTFRTSLFVKHPFPEFEGERFIGEGSSFLFIELESKGVYINKVIYLCNYLEDGLTKAGRKMRIMNPQGGRFNSRIYMDKHLPLKTRIRKGFLYVCYSKFAHTGFCRMVKENENKLLTLLSYIPGSILYYYWNKKFLNKKEKL